MSLLPAAFFFLQKFVTYMLILSLPLTQAMAVVYYVFKGGKPTRKILEGMYVCTSDGGGIGRWHG
jgi:hypothetical protein